MLNQFVYFQRVYSDKEEKFTDCFRNRIQKTFEENLACQSALINQIRLSPYKPQCTPEASRNGTSAALDLIVDAMQRLDDIGCPMPCSQTTYSGNLMTQHTNAFELFTGEKRTQDYLLYFYYSSLESDVEAESLIIDFPNLIANVGGYLGLLLGFSCLTIYLYLLELAKIKLR